MASKALKITCFAPVETQISDGLYSKLFSRFNLPIMAFFKAAVPSTAVYFVSPFLIASIAAFLIFSGVSKSGSPIPREIISLPAAFNSAAFIATAMVGEAFIFPKEDARNDIFKFFY